MQDAYPELTATGDVIRVVQQKRRGFHHSWSWLRRLESLIESSARCRSAEFGTVVRDWRSREDYPEKSACRDATPDASTQMHRRRRGRSRVEAGATWICETEMSLSYKLGTSHYPPSVAGAQMHFSLYDTFGLPLDFIQEPFAIPGCPSIKPDRRAMDEQRARARASWKGAAKQTANPAYQQLPKSEFEGYRQTRSENCEVLA